MSGVTIGMIGFGDLRKGEKIRLGKNQVGEISTKNLTIPDYQRPYAWEERQVETLLNDLKDVIESKKESYLLGSLIFHENTKDGTFDVVDGQQRLVTLALIYHFLGISNSKSEKAGCRCEECSDFLMNQKFSHSESQKNLKNNFDYIQKWFRRQGKEVEQNIMGLLKADKIEFVCIVTPNLDDAFIFFDSANSKGKKLEDYDLIKAYHLRELNQDKNSFEKIVTNFESFAKNSKDFKNIFKYILAPTRQWVKNNRVDIGEISIYREFCDEISRGSKGRRSEGVLNLTHSFLGGEDFFEYLNTYMGFINKAKQSDLYRNIPSKNFDFVSYLYLAILCLCYSKFGDEKILDSEMASRIFRIAASMRLQVQVLREERMRNWACEILPKIFWMTFECNLENTLNELERLCEDKERKESKGEQYKTKIDEIIKGDNK